MLRQLTAGESHGKALVATVEGLPAAISVRAEDLAAELARRRLGYGRSGRQKWEADAFEILTGVRHGLTIGSPISVTVQNKEWDKKWTSVMAVEGELDPSNRLTRPRPGHADLAGVQKYGFDDVRNVLERASARETAARVAAGYFSKAFLAALGIQIVSHVVRIGKVSLPARVPPPGPGDLRMIDRSPVRCVDETVSKAMVAEIDVVRKARDTIGGIIEVLAYGCPPGLGSYVQSDRKLDARLAGAFMSIQSAKGVEFGDGFATASRLGSKAHDVILPGAAGPVRKTARAGGIEGGMSTGQPIRVRAALKPFSSLPKALPTVDLDSGKAASAINQRTDVCAVPAGAVVGEAAMAFVLAEAVLEKFGGDSLPETLHNLEGYLAGL